jgi:putative oxygen-independent coproporphyrinogen III oxidase
MPALPPTSAYIHIPFCRRRCFYCDFPIAVVGDRLNGSNSGTIAQYVDRLCTEIRLSANWGGPLQTVFFGGGTPSLLAVGQVVQILQTLDRRFGIAPVAEISMEIDPGTFDLRQIQGYRVAGVNRVSLGVQALQAELLALCGRTHTVTDVYAAVDLIRQVGLENFSLDLISGLPTQSLAQWQESLAQAIALAPTHLSIYDLTIEPMTPFSKQYQPGNQPLPTDQVTAAMYRLAQSTLTAAGYHHYEISSYAQPGYQCRHNRVYWENRAFYGFGMGATSYLQGDRVARPRKTREYYEWVDQLALTPTAPNSPPPVSPAELLLDTLMVGFRLTEGIGLEPLATQFGRSTLEQIWQCLRSFQPQGWVEVVDEQGEAIAPTAPLPAHGRLRLTDPEGFLFSNLILVKLFETFSDDG